MGETHERLSYLLRLMGSFIFKRPVLFADNKHCLQRKKIRTFPMDAVVCGC